MQINNTTKKHRTVKKAYPYLSSPYKQLVLQDCKLELLSLNDTIHEFSFIWNNNDNNNYNNSL